VVLFLSASSDWVTQTVTFSTPAPADCVSELGIESRFIADGAMTALSTTARKNAMKL
jgi:hypothetical protein